MICDFGEAVLDSRPGRRSAALGGGASVPMQIIQNRSYETVDRRIEATTNPRHRAMLRDYRAHMEYELTADIDSVMTIVSPNAVYHSFGREGTKVLTGHDEIRAHYEQGMTSHRALERVLDRLLVDDDAIFADGPVHLVYTGKHLIELGLPADPNLDYVNSFRAGVTFVYEGDGENVVLVGEDSYSTALPLSLETLTPIDPKDVITPNDDKAVVD